MRTNTSSAALYAVSGVPELVLPNYALALGAKLVPIDVGMKHRLNIWLTYHPDLRNSVDGFAKFLMGGDFRVSMKNSSTHSI